MQAPFHTAIAETIWKRRYRFEHDGHPVDQTQADTWARIARAAARPEPAGAAWCERFTELLAERAFLPGGRIIAGAGTGRRVTLANCFVMGTLADGVPDIFDALRDGALTLQAGGGIGVDFSPLCPAGSPTPGAGPGAAGPVAFMRVWDAMCATVSATGQRRGAVMATLRVDHPDILDFIDAKRDPGALDHCNCSVLISDAFMAALAADTPWPLEFQGRCYRTTSARELWQAITESAYAHSEPGVLFVDRINRENNLAYRETLTATNPCGEVPLPPWGACLLGSFNLTAFVREPFSRRASFDYQALAARVDTAVRLLDNLLDFADFPLAAQRREALATRRLGLGFMGLGSALILLGLRYDEAAGRTAAAAIARTLRDSAYASSIELARERGAFPALEVARHLERPFIQRLPAKLRNAIARHGIRNSHLLAVAPTGTISLLADNVSSGIEPPFRPVYTRQVLGPAGVETIEVEAFTARLWRERFGATTPLPSTFQSAAAIAPKAHLEMQAAVQPFVDQAIAKTINVPADLSYEGFQSIYRSAYELELKGVTTFRPRPERPGVLR